jgi:cAMP-binding proteins - catabolite gene activator and regulatory subunit of cAMP-dependent protein kinases
MREIRDERRLNDYLDRFRLTDVFSEDMKRHLALYRFEPDDALCRQGDEPEYVFLIVLGKVKVYTTSAEGRTLLINFTKPLGVIGEIECLKGWGCLNTVTAVTPTEAIGIHKRHLDLFREEVPFLQFLLDRVTGKFYAKSLSLSTHLLYPVEVRFASYLLSVSSEQGDGTATRISLSNMKDIADLIGTSYRHLNRVIQSFVASGLAERRQGTLVVMDREGLASMAGGNIYENGEGRDSL